MVSEKSIRIGFTGAVAIGGIVIAVTAFGYGFGSFRTPGPGFFPFFIGLCISGLGMATLISEVRLPKNKTLFDSEEGENRFLLTSAAIISWVALLDFAGFFIMTFIVTFSLCKIFDLKGIIKPFLLSLGTSIFIYMVFELWFYSDLPRGLII